MSELIVALAIAIAGGIAFLAYNDRAAFDKVQTLMLCTGAIAFSISLGVGIGAMLSKDVLRRGTAAEALRSISAISDTAGVAALAVCVPLLGIFLLDWITRHRR